MESIMKRFITGTFSAILAFSLAAAALPGRSCAAAERCSDEIIYYSFDEDFGNFSKPKFFSGVSAELTDGKYGKAVQISNFYQYQSMFAEVTVDLNRRYRVSYWVKGVDNYKGYQSCIIMQKQDYHKNSLGADATNGNLKNQNNFNYEYAGIPAATNTGVEFTDEWQYVEEEIVFDTGNSMTDEVGTTKISPMIYQAGKVGNDYIVPRTSKITFCIDELKIEPLDIVENGDMSEIGNFTFNSSTRAYVTKEHDNSILALTNTGSGVADMCDLVDLREGERYRISYRARTLAGSNRTQVLFIRDSGLYTERCDPPYESIDEDTVTSEWQTFTHEFTSKVKTTETLAYRYPQMIFRVKQAGTVYVDDLRIEKICNEIKNIKLSGICKAGAQVHASFTAAAGQYSWRLADADSLRTVNGIGGELAGTSFDFTLPQGYEELVLCIAPSGSDNEVRYDIKGIAAEDYIPAETAGEQRIGISLADSVWSGDFEELRVKFAVKNITDELYGAVALYDESGALSAVAYSALSEGEQILAADAAGAVTAKALVLDDNHAPKTEYRNFLKDTTSKFIYVDPINGRNNLKSTYSSPSKTVAYALKRAQKYDSAYVMLKAGEYRESLTLTDIDSGTTIASYGGRAVFSGKGDITGWELFDAERNIYRAPVAADSFRQLYVNGRRAVRARNPFAPAVVSKTDTGYILADTSLVGVNNISDAEFVYLHEWTNPRCGIASIADNGDGTSTAVMEQSCWALFKNKGTLEPTAPTYVENAYEFLDTAGEWYFDKSEKYLYYMPREGEDMTRAEAAIPTVQTIVSVAGTYSNPVRNIAFKNIDFEYSGWTKPDTEGYSDAQAGKIRRNGRDECPPAAVEAVHAENISFDGCGFKKLGMSGLSMLWGIKNASVTGCEFGDISGSGIYVGTPYRDDACTAAGQSSSVDMCSGITISDNYLHDIGIDYNSCVPISTIHIYGAVISNNEIFNATYSGIHDESGIGTDRTGHEIKNNYIHRILNGELFDGGSIYVTGASGGAGTPWNVIRGNYIENQLAGYAALYTDNRSSGWRLCDNVVDFSMVSSWGAKTPLQWLLNIGSRDIYCDNNYTTVERKNLISDFWLDSEHTQESLITNTHVFDSAAVPDEAKEIATAAGPAENYDALVADRYQITLSADDEIALTCGMTKPLRLYGAGGKGTVLAPDNVLLVSDTPDIVSVSGTSVTGKRAGLGRVSVYTAADGYTNRVSVTVRVY